MYEHRHEPLLPRAAYLIRVARHALFAGGLIAGALGIGIVGYHFTEGLSWIDSFVNTAMLLGGMGPVNELHTVAGKLFASAYALFSGVIFLLAVGVFFAPIAHRFLHHFHLEVEDQEGGP